MSKYIRTTIKYFSELPENTQTELLKDNEAGDLHEDTYVIDPCDRSNYLPLSMFMRMESKLWNGHYIQSAFSAYFIKISRDGETVTVGYRHW